MDPIQLARIYISRSHGGGYVTVKVGLETTVLQVKQSALKKIKTQRCVGVLHT